MKLESFKVDDHMKELLIQALIKTQGNRYQTAKLLGIAERTLYLWMRKWKLEGQYKKGMTQNQFRVDNDIFIKVHGEPSKLCESCRERILGSGVIALEAGELDEIIRKTRVPTEEKSEAGVE